jgi:Tol biopolymer transport system component/DNA-binding winged helix-turn-helix (wHTH) protein
VAVFWHHPFILNWRNPMARRSAIVRFGVFEADPEVGELRRNGLKLKLQDQPFRILLMLLENPGKIVMREEMRTRVWPEGTFVDFDHSLNASINKLREALGDTASNARFIETVPRRGYRFIAPVERSEPAATPLPPYTRPRKRVAAFVAVAIALGAVIAGVALRKNGGTNLPPPRIVPLTSTPGVEVDPSFSPDGNFVAYSGTTHTGSTPVSGWGTQRNIYIQQLGSDTPRQLTTTPTNDRSPRWSPDGRYIAFARALSPEETAIAMAPALGGSENILLRIHERPRKPFFVLLDWFPGSGAIVVADCGQSGDRFSLYGVDISSGDRWRLTDPPPPGLGDLDPAISPDGRLLLFTRYAGNEQEADIYVLDLDERGRAAGEPRPLTRGKRLSRAPIWMPHGQEILFSSGPQHRSSLWRMRAFQGATPSPVGLGVEGYFLLTASLSGQGNRLAYSRFTADADIHQTEISVNEKRVVRTGPFLSSTAIESLPEYSPDGSQIAFVSARSGVQEIWISGADGSSSYQLTNFQGDPEVSFPRWSPDGRRLVFAGGRSVYVWDLNARRAVVVAKDVAREAVADWSRDGKWLYLLSNRTGREEIWKMPAAGSPEMIQVTKNGGGAMRASPGGRFLYYAKGERGPALFRVPVTGGEEVQVIEKIANNGCFALTGSSIYFIPPADAEERSSVESVDVRTGARTTIARIDRLPLWGLSVTHNGRFILHTQLDKADSDLMLVENFR